MSLIPLAPSRFRAFLNRAWRCERGKELWGLWRSGLRLADVNFSSYSKVPSIVPGRGRQRFPVSDPERPGSGSVRGRPPPESCSFLACLSTWAGLFFYSWLNNRISQMVYMLQDPEKNHILLLLFLFFFFSQSTFKTYTYQKIHDYPTWKISSKVCIWIQDMRFIFFPECTQEINFHN